MTSIKSESNWIASQIRKYQQKNLNMSARQTYPGGIEMLIHRIYLSTYVDGFNVGLDLHNRLLPTPDGGSETCHQPFDNSMDG